MKKYLRLPIVCGLSVCCLGNICASKMTSQGRPDSIFSSVTNGAVSNSPMVVLLGWAGSKDADLTPYAKIYENLGFASVRHITPKYTVFYGETEAPKFARHLLEFLEKQNASQRPILIHMFSNMGVLTLQSMEPHLREGGQFRSLLSNIQGLVFDSCPGRPTLTSFFYALTGHVLEGPYFWRYLQFCGHLVKLLWVSVANSGVNREYSWYNFMTKQTSLKVPALFMYSRGDKCIPSADIETLTETLPGSVSKTDFIDSPHVGHFDKHPEAYAQSINAFVLEKLNL